MEKTENDIIGILRHFANIVEALRRLSVDRRRQSSFSK